MADETTFELGHMGTLTAALTFLFAEAAGLPDPTSVSLFGVIDGEAHDAATLQFPPVQASTETVILWAWRFGGVIESHTLEDDKGVRVYVQARFIWQDVLNVQVFTLFPLPCAEAASIEQASEPETATLF